MYLPLILIALLGASFASDEPPAAQVKGEFSRVADEESQWIEQEITRQALTLKKHIDRLARTRRNYEAGVYCDAHGNGNYRFSTVERKLLARLSMESLETTIQDQREFTNAAEVHQRITVARLVREAAELDRAYQSYMSATSDADARDRARQAYSRALDAFRALAAASRERFHAGVFHLHWALAYLREGRERELHPSWLEKYEREEISARWALQRLLESERRANQDFQSLRRELLGLTR